MKEIKATAQTREELYQECKRVREENERLTNRLEVVYRVIEDEGLINKFSPLWDFIIGEQNK